MSMILSRLGQPIRRSFATASTVNGFTGAVGNTPLVRIALLIDALSVVLIALTVWLPD